MYVPDAQLVQLLCSAAVLSFPAAHATHAVARACE
jgi:hypothetical protein